MRGQGLFTTSLLFLMTSVPATARAQAPQPQHAQPATRSSDAQHQMMMPSRHGPGQHPAMMPQGTMDCSALHQQMMSEMQALRSEMASLRAEMHRRRQ